MASRLSATPRILHLLSLSCTLFTSDSWITPLHQRNSPTTLLAADVLDVEFERVDETPSNREIDEIVAQAGKSLFDLSLEADVEFNATRIPFIDGDRYIDVKLAFMAEVDGERYGIAVPFDHPAAMTYENSEGAVSYLAPDGDDNEELMEIMAAQLVEHVGEDLRLKRTPRVLTIEGPLEQYTKNWQENLIPKPIETEKLLDESDEDLDFFHNFMREELGEEEYQKTLNESPDSIDEGFLNLFDIPGFGDLEDDEEGIADMIKSIFTSEEQQVSEMRQFGPDLDNLGLALKLVSYRFANGKAYSLVSLLKPYALVGKFVDEENDVRFELLSREEEKLLIPRLESVCQSDLEAAGLKLQ